MDKNVMKRLLVGDDGEGYNLLGRAKQAGMFLATGKESAGTTGDSALDTQLKMQRLQTGSPDFQRELAQTKADVALQQALAADEAKINAKRDRLTAAGYGGQTAPSAGGATFGVSQPGQSSPSLVNGSSPLGQMGKGSPKLLYSVPTIDKETGVTLPDYQLADNPDYISSAKQREYDAEDALKKEAEEAGRTASKDMLDTIGQVKRGSKYFGFGGGLPSEVAPSTYDRIKNPLMPLGYDKGAYEDRKNWESNMNKIVAQKVFDTIQKMQAASKTGATGLGPVSEPEFKALQSAATALNKGLGEQDALRILNEMEAIQRKFLNLPADEPQQAVQPSAGRQLGRFKLIGE